MAYEIDFIGVGESVKKDSDAIAFRWLDEEGIYRIGVYDGGFKANGDKLDEHLNTYYFNEVEDGEDKVIDCVICSHPDGDHAIGLKKILNEFKVKTLYMNRPWLYIDDVKDSVNDGRITRKSLEQHFKNDDYAYIGDLEEAAEDNGVEIHEAFQGDVIMDKLMVLSPSRELYIQLMKINLSRLYHVWLMLGGIRKITF
jgi:hypothetical protein